MVQVSLAVALACTASLIWTCALALPKQPDVAIGSKTRTDGSSGNEEGTGQDEKTFFFKESVAYVRLTDKTIVPMSLYVLDVWRDALKDQLATEYKQTSLTASRKQHLYGRLDDLCQTLLNQQSQLVLTTSNRFQLSYLGIAYAFEYSKITTYRDQISQINLVSSNMPDGEETFGKVLEIMEEEVQLLIETSKPFSQDHQKSTTALPVLRSQSVTGENSRDEKMFFIEGENAFVRLGEDRNVVLNIANYNEWFVSLKNQLESKFINKTVTLERKLQLEASMMDVLNAFNLLESQVTGITVRNLKKWPLLKLAIWYEITKVAAYDFLIKQLQVATPPSIPEKDHFDKDLDIMKQEIEYLMKESELPVAYETYKIISPVIFSSAV